MDGVFEEIDKLAEETRLNERAGQQRFGNTAFREFFQLVEEVGKRKDDELAAYARSLSFIYMHVVGGPPMDQSPRRPN